MNHTPGALTRIQQFLPFGVNPRKFFYFKTFRSIVIIILLNCIPGGQSIFAQWSSDPDVNTIISTATNSRYFPVIVSGGEGSSIIVWIDLRNGATADIYAQRINASGVAEWTENGVAICTAANDQYAPTIVSDGAGGAIITWYDYRSGNAADIYAQRINANGEIEWATNGIAICSSSNHQSVPAMISDGAGGAIITWTDERTGSGSDIYAQHINAAGVMEWTANGVAICTMTNNQNSAAIISDGANGAIITWTDYRNGSASDIYAQRINSAGLTQWATNGVSVCTAPEFQYGSHITFDGAAGAIITWRDYRNAGSADIFAQRINAAGVAEWTINGVAVCTASNDQYVPDIVSDGSGGAIITWFDNATASNANIYAQRINANGVVEWITNGVAICIAPSDQKNPSIVSDGDGGAIIAWDDYRSSNHSDIYAQRINAGGTIEWMADGIPISTATGSQSLPTIVSNNDGGTIITWFDYRSGNYSDIYAQNITATGMIGCTTTLITNQPLITQTVFQGAAAGDLIVTATGNELNYQWYSNTTASTTGAMNLNSDGAGFVFTPSTATQGTLYYYCMVTGTCDTLYSDFARVTVNAPISRLEVTVSPNPTESFFNLAVRSPRSEPVDIRMFDMLGRLVALQHGVPGQTFKLGEKVAAAMYIIEVRQGDQTVITKVVKQ